MSKVYQGSISLAKVQDGQSGTPGTNTATVYLYQRATTTPQKPNGQLTYTFSTGIVSGSALGNWKQNIAELTGTNPIYFILAVASSTNTTDTIESGDWKGPSILAQDGQDGQNGRGVKEVDMKFINWATNTSAQAPTTSSSGWSESVPIYNSSKPYYYVWVRTNYNDNSTPTDEIYLDNGLSDANRTAAIANSISQSAEENAQGAMSIASNTQQHFWWIGQDYSTAVKAGAYMTQVSQESFKSSPTNQPNLLLRSDSINLRYGADVHAQLVQTGLKVAKGGLESTGFNTDNYIYAWSEDRSDRSIAINGSGNKTDWRLIAGKKFGVDKAGNLYASSATISGAITANTGFIGGTSGWTITAQQLSSGTIGADNSLYMGTKNLGNNTSIGGRAGSDWRFTVGSKFGVTNTGALYASSATISGAITATSGSFSGAVYASSGYFKGLEIQTSAGVKVANIDSSGCFTVYKDNSSVATFGSTVTIGKSNQTRAEIDFHSLVLKDKESNKYFEVKDLRGTDGSASITEIFVGDGITQTFSLSYLATNDTYAVVVKDGSGGTVTKKTLFVSFSTAPTRNTTITVTYVTTSDRAKSYTIGLRKSNSKEGGLSVAEGVDSIASGFVSHAEGGETAATGNACHAEGSLTEASHSSSHAEGWGTKASGLAAHSEGWETKASGYYAHAGGYYTTAQYESQTVIGKFNKNNTLNLFEVGNGSSDSARSNAFSVTADTVCVGMNRYTTSGNIDKTIYDNLNSLGWSDCYNSAL